MIKRPIVTVVIILSLSVAACQKAKEPESQKTTPTQKAEVKQQPTEAKPEATPAQPPIVSEEGKTESQPKQEEKQTAKFVETKEKSTEDKNLATDADRKKVEAKFHGEILREAFKNHEEIIEYLKILMKGNHKTFHLNTPDKPGATEGEPLRRFQYGDVIRILLSYIKIKDAFPFAIEILKTKRDYPEAMSTAAKILKFGNDKSVIPLLQETARHPAPQVRLEAAGSLLSLGDADTALPILDELAEKEGYSSALYYLFTKKPGKTIEIIDERGYTIVEKALNNQEAVIRIHAVKLLLESKKMKKERAEEIALATLDNFKSSKEYGIGVDDKRGIIPLPGFEKDFEKSNLRWGSDWRAIETAISILKELESKKAIPALERLANNPDASYLAREARETTEILKKGGRP